MATLFQHKTGGLYVISDGPLGKYTGHYKIARAYNTFGLPGEHVLDFKKGSMKFKDFKPVGTVHHGLSAHR